MKNIVKIVLISFVIAAFSNNVNAQKVAKLAHIDSQALMQSMPEYDSAVVKIQAFIKDLQGEIENQQVEINRKSDEFQKNSANLTELVRTSRQQEIAGMYQRLQEFQQNAEQTVQQEQAKLFQPVQEKATKAIEAVAKENGVTYVLEAQQVLLYKAGDALDLTPLVKQHLGIKK
ncbi:MAG: OmpH family outer membrane protein [Bacteroidales bacterium]|jgi:outer membrane protein|nr:OmpH family outer membrane protein [Bacteroidales bacterium]